MKIFYSYISVSLIRTTLLVLLLLVGMDFFIQMTNGMMDVSHGKYGLKEAFECVLYALPNDVYRFFPMAGLMGSLLALGSLANHRELLVMEASGMSPWHIINTVIVTVLALVLFTTLIGETLGPPLLSRSEAIKLNAKSHGQAIQTPSGTWFRDGTAFIHMTHMTPRGKVQGISRYVFDKNNELKKVSYAKEGEYNNKKWQMREVEETILGDRQTQVQKKSLDTWVLQLKPQLLSISALEPRAMSLPHLLRLIHYKKGNKDNYERESLVYWQRLLAPFAVCIMMILAIPFVFGPLREANLGLRMVVGILVGFSFYTLNHFLGALSLVYGILPFWGAFLPLMFFSLLGIGFILLHPRMT